MTNVLHCGRSIRLVEKIEFVALWTVSTFVCLYASFPIQNSTNNTMKFLMKNIHTHQISNNFYSMKNLFYQNSIECLIESVDSIGQIRFILLTHSLWHVWYWLWFCFFFLSLNIDKLSKNASWFCSHFQVDSCDRCSFSFYCEWLRLEEMNSFSMPFKQSIWKYWFKTIFPEKYLLCIETMGVFLTKKKVQ